MKHLAAIISALLLYASPLHAEEISLSGRGFLEAGVGVGGLFSTGAENLVLLTNAQVGYHFEEPWSLGLGFSMKSHPWRDEISLFQTLGPSARWHFYKGFHLGFGLGLAWSYIKSHSFQQSKLGPGWMAELGYSHFFHPNVGITANIAMNQRWLDSLYTDFGINFGPTFFF